jgi:hypothetical protein
MKRDLPDECFEEWQRAVAEELLFLRSCGKSCGSGESLFENVSPFGNSITLKQCSEHKCAMAVFPLDTSGSDAAEPGIAHIWVIKGVETFEILEDMDVMDEGNGVYVVASPENISGKSWQLAGRLAERALSDDTEKYMRESARQWIITGRVKKGDRVAKVHLGNKLELNRKGSSILIPRDNRGDITAEHERNFTIRTAPDLDTAWNHISGVGIKKMGEQPWPPDVKELHILVGKIIKTAIASILLVPEAEKIVLWHSDNEDNSSKPAGYIEEVCKLLDIDVVTEKLCLSSSLMADAEAELR